jgi:hypothetical protein
MSYLIDMNKHEFIRTDAEIEPWESHIHRSLVNL